MAQEFTPGPWAVHPHAAYIVPDAQACRSIGGAEDDAVDLARYAQEICALHHPDRHRSEAETRANARLIAAAPDMYEALEGIEHFSDALAHRQDTLSVALRQWINAGKAALAKARATAAGEGVP